MSKCGYMDTYQVTSTEDTDCDINRDCEVVIFFLLCLWSISLDMGFGVYKTTYWSCNKVNIILNTCSTGKVVKKIVYYQIDFGEVFQVASRSQCFSKTFLTGNQNMSIIC